MLAEAELDEYLQEIRKQVCARCIERPEGGPPCAPLGKQCGIEMHLSQLIDTIHQIQSDSIAPYLTNNRCKICQHCSELNGPECPCPMDYLAVLLVGAVEDVDRRHEKKAILREALLPRGINRPGLDEVVRTFEEGFGQWTGCDWHTRFGMSGLDLEGWTAETARRKCSEVVGSEAWEEWKAATAWLAEVECEAHMAEAHATMTVVAANAGDWKGALEHARMARVIEFNTRRPLHSATFTWHPLYQAVEAAARANGVTADPL
jgi:hypothetical protein